VITLDSLRLFRDLAQVRNLTKAAEMNGISASAASQHLHELERVWGVQLVDRSTRPVSLTEAGKLYSDTCRDILRRWEDFRSRLEAMKPELSGVVRIASIYSIGLSEMSALESEFRRRHPGARVEVDYLRPEKVREAVEADRVDLGLVSYPESTRELAVIPWRQEEMVVAAAPGHPITTHQFVRPADLENLPFVAFDEDLPIRRHIDRYLAAHEVAVNVVMHFDNLQTIKEAIALGNVVSIVPRRVIRAEIAEARLVAVALQPELFRPLGIIHRKRKRFSPAAQAFLRLLAEEPKALELATQTDHPPENAFVGRPWAADSMLGPRG
jgi:DNA-binding transcriptional LysR family regulator